MPKFKTITEFEHQFNWPLIARFGLVFLFLPLGIMAYIKPNPGVFNNFFCIGGTIFFFCTFLIRLFTDRWIYRKRYQIMNVKDLGDGKRLLEISREGPGEASTWIVKDSAKDNSPTA